MNKLRRVLFLILPLAVGMSSCLKDDLEDLESQLAELEKALGSNEPIVFSLSTKDDDDQNFTKNKTFLLKYSDWDNTFSDYGDGEYYINVERTLNLDGDSYTRIRFYYNIDTKEVYDANLRINYDEPDQYFYSNIYDYEAGVTFTVKVNSFDPNAGNISFTVTIVTDETADDNWFYEQPMSISASFNGVLANYPD